MANQDKTSGQIERSTTPPQERSPGTHLYERGAPKALLYAMQHATTRKEHHATTREEPRHTSLQERSNHGTNIKVQLETTKEEHTYHTWESAPPHMANVEENPCPIQLERRPTPQLEARTPTTTRELTPCETREERSG